MSLAKKNTVNIPIKTSNLKAAIKQLDGRSFRVDPQQVHGPSTKSFNAVRVAETIPAQSSGSRQDVTIPEVTPQLRSNDASLDQGQQLIQHLQLKEQELIRQDADYQVRVWNWQQEAAKQQRILDERQEDLNEQETQLRTLQFDLLQLQNELINSQLATRQIMNQLEVPGQEANALGTLRFELNQRFDHMMITWRQFAQQMQDLAADLADEVEPNQIEL